MTIEIRRADPGEAEILTAIAFAAKRHWGYPEDWIKLWETELTLAPEFIRRHEVYRAGDGDRAVGVYALAGGPTERSVEHFWVDPPYIGRGVGATMYEHAVERARSKGARRLRILSDPNAEGFYVKMGARKIGEEPSTPRGRMLPLLVAEIAS